MKRDLAIIGAGPAGMAAAIAARARGLSVALFDEQDGPGGQIYRGITRATPARATLIGKDYAAGRALADAFLSSGADYHPRSTVWRLGSDGVSWTSPAGGGECEARRVLVATGAIERPFPIPGWTLPGVMTAGAAQILLKTAGAVADGAVLIGCGPLLYLLAAQYLRAGARIAALLDTTAPAAYRSAPRHIPQALRAAHYLTKGLGLLAAIRRAGVPHHRGVANIRIDGEASASAVSWEDRRGRHEVACDHVFLHQGVIPNPNAVMAAGGQQDWDERQLCFRPVLDEYGRSSRDWLFVAGDGGGILGARAADLSGRIAAETVALDLGIVAPEVHRAASAPLLAARRREAAIRPFLDTLYRPQDALRAPAADDTIVCRCEEVRRRDIAAAVDHGCVGPNQLKAYTRAGMGPCQGRLCGLTVVETIARLRGENPASVGYYRIRMPLKPVTVGEIAGLAQGEEN